MQVCTPSQIEGLRTVNQQLEAFAEKSGTAVAVIAFVFWGAVQIWSIWVAIFGGRYPWPASYFLEASQGGEWLVAVLLFLAGGVLVAATVGVWQLLVVLPLTFVARQRDQRSS